MKHKIECDADIKNLYEKWFRSIYPDRLEAIEQGRMLPPLEADDEEVEVAFKAGFLIGASYIVNVNLMRKVGEN
jgi:hypothetical protein